MARRVLIVEDDLEIAELVRLHLRDIHCEADIVQRGQEALVLAAQHPYDLVILDLMLPDMDGLTVCQYLRGGSDYVPILMLTAKSTELDRVLGLEMGGDDYVTKPFSFPELLARVKAVFRRAEAMTRLPGTARNDRTVRIRELLIELDKHQAKVRGQELELTAKEFDLLVYLARNPGCVFSRSQLLDQVWGYGHEGYEHTVNSHINRLRAKLEANPTKPEYILTVWGVGYKFTDR